MTKDKCTSIRKKKNILNLAHFSLRNVSTSGCCNIASCVISDAAAITAVTTAICIWCFGANVPKSTVIFNRNIHSNLVTTIYLRVRTVYLSLPALKSKQFLHCRMSLEENYWSFVRKNPEFPLERPMVAGCERIWHQRR